MAAIGRRKVSAGETAPYLKMYSVYDKKTDMPVIVYATAKECAKAMGIEPCSFYRYLTRIRDGRFNVRKWDIYVDEEEMEDG